MSEDEEAVIESVGLSMQILDCLQRTGGGGVTEIAEETGLPKSTAHKHLTSLVALGAVHKEGTTYRVSASMLSYLGAVTDAVSHYDVLVEQIDALSDITDSCLFCFIPEGDRCICIYASDDDGEYSPGDTLGLDDSAPGLAILSTYENERIADLDVGIQADQQLSDDVHFDDDGNLALPIVGPAKECLGAITVYQPYQMQESGRFGELAGQMKAIQSKIRQQLS